MDRYLYRIENLLYLVINHPVVRANLKSILTYSSVFLFVGLVGFISISVNNYINRTMSISIVEAQSAQQMAEREEALEHSSTIVKVNKGDTLELILKKQATSQEDISKITKIIQSHNPKYLLKSGQEITFNYELKLIEDDSDLASEVELLSGITIRIDKLNSIDIVRSGDGFSIQSTTIPVAKFITKSTEVINSNLMTTLKSLGISASNIADLISAYSYQVDFQRQIHSGDTVTVIMEKFTTEDGTFSHHGKVLFASLILSGKPYNIYRYNHDNNPSFFSEDGKSVKRSLLKTPVNIMRISSGFGKRHHPIDGYTKMHKGIDFAAPEGTPIYAAGDGVITELGVKSGYGNFIQIKHSPTLSTAYGHARGFAKNLKVGSRIKQGHVIAYVGKTGKATAAHLHYEVKIDGKHVNPLSIKTTPGVELAGNSLNGFQKFKAKIGNLSASLDQKLEIAENEFETIR